MGTTLFMTTQWGLHYFQFQAGFLKDVDSRLREEQAVFIKKAEAQLNK